MIITPDVLNPLKQSNRGCLANVWVALDMQTLKHLLLLTPNTLVILTTITWVAAASGLLQKREVPRLFWVELTTITLLLPQLRSGWPLWPLVSYLPEPIFKSSVPYLHLALPHLPAILALPAAFVHRRLPGYVLSAAGGIYLLLFGVIMLCYNGGLIA